MPSFAFQARDTAGRHHSGVVEAATPSAVAQTLRRRGWLVTGVKPASGDGAEVDLLTQLNQLLAPAAVGGYRTELQADGGHAPWWLDAVDGIASTRKASEPS